MITRRGRTVLEDIREYWGELTQQAREAHRAAHKSVGPSADPPPRRLSVLSSASAQPHKLEG